MTRIQSINCDESQSFQLHNQTHANHSHVRRPTLLIPPTHIPKIARYDKLANNHYHNRTKSLRSKPDPQSKMGYTHRKLDRCTVYKKGTLYKLFLIMMMYAATILIKQICCFKRTYSFLVAYHGCKAVDITIALPTWLLLGVVMHQYWHYLFN